MRAALHQFCFRLETKVIIYALKLCSKYPTILSKRDPGLWEKSPVIHYISHFGAFDKRFWWHSVCISTKISFKSIYCVYWVSQWVLFSHQHLNLFKRRNRRCTEQNGRPKIFLEGIHFNISSSVWKAYRTLVKTQFCWPAVLKLISEILSFSRPFYETKYIWILSKQLVSLS